MKQGGMSNLHMFIFSFKKTWQLQFILFKETGIATCSIRNHVSPRPF